MDGFTIVDGVAAGVILISAVLAYSRGFVRETFAIAGWVVAAILAFVFAGSVEPLVSEVPVVGEFFADSCELSIVAAFAAVFAVALVVVSVFTPLFSGIIRRSALGGLDQGLGFFFGVLRGLVLVAVAFVLYERVVINDSIAMVDDSRSAVIFESVRSRIEKQIPDTAPQWIVQRYEQLVGSCAPADT